MPRKITPTKYAEQATGVRLSAHENFVLNE